MRQDLRKKLAKGIVAAAVATMAACSGSDVVAGRITPPLVVEAGKSLTTMQGEQEPNNVPAEASAVTSTESLFGELAPGVDVVDLYRFRLSSARSYRFTVDGAPAQLPLAIVDTVSGQRFESTSGEMDVNLLAGRDYLIEITSDNSGPSQQAYEVALFQPVTTREPPERCDNHGEICP